MYNQYRPRNIQFNMYRNYRSMPNFINNTRSMTPLSSQILGKAITVPKSSGLFRSLLGTTSSATSSKLGLTGILGGISKTINTVNQAMPLINQVKPLFGNVKTVVNVVKGFRNKKDNSPQKNYKSKINNTNDETKVNSTINIKNQQKNYQFTPNKPYFS